MLQLLLLMSQEDAIIACYPATNFVFIKAFILPLKTSPSDENILSNNYVRSVKN